MDSFNSTRRRFLTQSLTLAGVGLPAPKAPYVFARTKTTLRVLGTHVTLQEEIRQKAMADLGLSLIHI
jgi:putative spermidine/putrescine transport system substrate-binding protein